jgi:hypothetical protein
LISKPSVARELWRRLSKALRAQVGPGLWVAGGNLNGAARSDKELAVPAIFAELSLRES